MIFKNIKAYRKYYQNIEAGSSDPKLDIDFIGGKIEKNLCLYPPK